MTPIQTYIYHAYSPICLNIYTHMLMVHEMDGTRLTVFRQNVRRRTCGKTKHVYMHIYGRPDSTYVDSMQIRPDKTSAYSTYASFTRLAVFRFP